LPEPDAEPTLADVRAAIEAGFGPRAVMMAREICRSCDTTTMLELAALLTEHNMQPPLAGMWRNRTRDRREAQPYANALNALAATMIEQGRLEDAVRVLHEAIDEAPEVPYLRRNLASLLLEKEEYENALETCERLMAEDANDTETAELLGMIRYSTGDAMLALEPLQQAFDSGRASAGLWLLKAFTMTGDDGAAAEVLRRMHAEHRDRASALLRLELEEPGSPLHMLQGAPGIDALIQQLLA
jgi:tetratricopeptide (TPR) repeat protein